MQAEGFFISTDKLKLDLNYIHDYLSNRSYWAEGIPLETVAKSIEGSLCYGVYFQDKQIGFARVVTDLATFGYLADVFIDEQYRARGLGIWLMETIMADSRFEGLRHWILGTKDAHGLYAKFGFKPLDEPQRVMRKKMENPYGKGSSP
jgi:N-acetylglutamate synthase-like GNAT family acetyltransferase